MQRGAKQRTDSPVKYWSFSKGQFVRRVDENTKGAVSRALGDKSPTPGKIVYEIFIDLNQLQNWAVERTLFQVNQFLVDIKKQFTSFDFAGNNIVLNINPPVISNSEMGSTESNKHILDSIYYFENILKYEMQIFFEKVQKIPFIRDGKLFKEFIDAHKYEEPEA